MHVYISVDMEGISGVATSDQVIRGGTGYTRAQKLMTAETNAAIAGAFDGGASQVTVNDSHGTMDNLLHEELDPRARLIFGSPKAQCMAHGLTTDHDVALLVGYHAAAGEGGVLSHTFSSLFSRFLVNGKTVSEAEVVALQAGTLQVPIGLVTGDDVICQSARAAFAGVQTVSVKDAEGWTATNSLHPSTARAEVREAACRSVAGARNLQPVKTPDELVLEVEMQIPTAAELASLVPGARQVDPFTVRQTLSTPAEVLGLVSVWSSIAAQATRGRIPLLDR